MPNVEFYDDAGLYKAWLCNYTSRSSARDTSAPAPRALRTGEIRNRGSKGRGLRFEAHEKLKNFMFPTRCTTRRRGHAGGESV